MRSSSVLFAAFVMAAVAPVMSAPVSALKGMFGVGAGAGALDAGSFLLDQAGYVPDTRVSGEC